MDTFWCEKRNFRYLFFYVGGVIWTLLFVALLNNVNSHFVGKLVVIHLFAMSLMILLRSFYARNSLYFIFFGFIALYTIPAKLFFFDGLYFSAHHQVFSYYTATYATLIFSLFLLFVNLFIVIPHGRTNRLPYRKNSPVFWLFYFIAFIIVCTNRRQGNMYGGEEGGLSVLNEYVIILFLICFIYSSNEKIKNIALYFLYFLYAFFAVVTGGRVELVLLFFLLLVTVLQYKFSFNFLVLCFFFGVWSMTIFGKIRHNPTVLFQEDIITLLLPSNNHISDMGMQMSNEGDVYWASERLLCLMENGELSFSSRIEVAFSYLFSPLAPSSCFPEVADLSTYKKDVMSTGGGNLAPVNFYIMFGWGGTIFLGYFVAHMLNILFKQGHILSKVYVVLMITTISRWFAYNPIQLIKLCVWGLISYYLVICIDYTIKKYG